MKFASVKRRTPLRATLAATAAGIAAVGTYAIHTTAYAEAFAIVQSAVTCASTGTCVAGTNTGSGSGVAGTSKSGIGTTGTSTSGFGMQGSSDTRIGVYGTSNGTASNSVGVYGLSPYIGVTGKTTTGDGYGVIGYTSSGDGIWGQASSGGIGAGGQSSTGFGMYATSGSGSGLFAHSSSGIAVRASVDGSGFSVVGTSTNAEGAGGDFEGARFGVVGRAATTGYPLVLTDSSQQNVFYVSGTGDVYYHGNMQPFSRLAGGGMIASYTAKSTQPTVEDTGTANLVQGAAAVPLDPVFAATIDKNTQYRVFVTPGGDTRGLYVAAKTARGFIVRETQGGRANLTFDYRIVATGLGQTGRRMAVRTESAMPNVSLLPAETLPQPKLRGLR